MTVGTTFDASEKFGHAARKKPRTVSPGKRLFALAQDAAPKSPEQLAAAIPLLSKASDDEKSRALYKAVENKHFELSEMLVLAVSPRHLSPAVFAKKDDMDGAPLYTPMDLMLENDGPGERKWEALSEVAIDRVRAQVRSDTRPKR